MIPTWPPNYLEIYLKRQKMLETISEDPSLIRGAEAFYAGHPIEFINDWGMTFDPRNFAKGIPSTIPFVLFQRQKEFVAFVLSCLQDGENGLAEKCRDVGATWVCIWISIWLWRFIPGASVGWGSRKEALVDRLGDPDSIFEKIRKGIDYLPRIFWPKGFSLKQHAGYMKVINPITESSITGEAGDNIGRGGRSTVYFKDESAHYIRPENIEAALSENTDVAIDLSSVHGPTNVFARRRRAGVEWTPGTTIEPGKTRVFIFDWQDHPGKNREWYNRKRHRAEEEGLLHLFKQEVERDYMASVEGIVIHPDWVKAAKDLHHETDFAGSGTAMAGLDVMDEGGDKHAYACRRGAILISGIEWGGGDPGEAAVRACNYLKLDRCFICQYDNIGVGSGVKVEMRRQHKAGHHKELQFIGWNAASSVLYAKQRLIPGDKDSPTNEDFFDNLKAQAWWQLRLRFERTFKFRTQGHYYPPEDLISLDSKRIEHYATLEMQLCQPTYSTSAKSGKLTINKKPEGMPSPNLADAVVMSYWPKRAKKVII